MSSGAYRWIPEPPGRIVRREELLNVPEFEPMAERRLDPATFAAIAGGDRSAFQRITLRQRLLVDTTGLDLTLELFGSKMFAPILVGPAGQQQRFHPEGEIATARGAAAAKAAMVVSDRSSQPIEKVVAAAGEATFWYQVFPGGDIAAARERAKAAVEAGCRVVCITLGAPAADAGGDPVQGVSWESIDRLREGLGVPILLKGVMSAEEARTAVDRGIQGIVVSNYGGHLVPGTVHPVSVLASVAEAVGGRAAILVDGGFRRGSDVLKALALGAQAVLVSRPVLWGLAAYGAEGVQNVIEMLQTELARYMAMVGLVDLKAITPAAIRIHRR
ncbi:MAG: alpha-hydroxy-acid oxidizing protein [Bryobacteraceae bacterium]